MALKTITFTCETITPMFLSGADGQTPELRPPSIKGALRFWWRAMNGHLSLEELKKQEGEIFGDTSKRNKVIVKCKIVSNDRKQKINTINRDVFSGFHYLLYSAYMNKREYLPNLRFEISLSSYDSEYLLSASYAMWLLSNLGGLGTRSRRGAGNFLISEIEDKEEILSNFNFLNNSTDLIQLQIYFRENIDIIKKYFKVVSKTRKTKFNTFENYKIHIIDYSNVNIDFSNSTEVLNEIGMNFQAFRDGRVSANILAFNDYNSVKDFILLGNTPTTLEKANFGLPISYQYRSILDNNDRPKRANIEGAKKESSRSASSIIISLNRIGNNFCPIIINFDSMLLPVGAELKMSSKSQSQNKFFSKPNNTIKEDFIATLPNILI